MSQHANLCSEHEIVNWAIPISTPFYSLHHAARTSATELARAMRLMRTFRRLAQQRREREAAGAYWPERVAWQELVAIHDEY